MKKWLTRGSLLLLLILVLIIALTYHPDIPRAVLWEAYAFENSQAVTINDMPVHYRIVGEGQPLLLLHGTAASLHTWNGWVEELKQEYQLVMVDLPAFGLTGPQPNGDYSIDSYLAFVEHFRAAIGLDTFSLGGNSLGGLIAWNYAAQYPERVSHLILVDPSGFPTGKASPLAFRLAQSDIWSKTIRYLTPRFLVKKSLLDVYGQDSLVSDKLVDRYFDMLLREGNREAFIDRSRTSMQTDTSLLQQLNMPVLIMWGEKDEWIPVEHAERYSQLILKDTLVVFAELGHVPMEEDPRSTVAVVKGFLQQHN